MAFEFILEKFKEQVDKTYNKGYQSYDDYDEIVKTIADASGTLNNILERVQRLEAGGGTGSGSGGGDCNCAGELEAIKGELETTKSALETAKGELDTIKGDLNTIKDSNYVQQSVYEIQYSTIKSYVDNAYKGIQGIQGDIKSIQDNLYIPTITTIEADGGYQSLTFQKYDPLIATPADGLIENDITGEVTEP